MRMQVAISLVNHHHSVDIVGACVLCIDTSQGSRFRLMQVRIGLRSTCEDAMHVAGVKHKFVGIAIAVHIQTSAGRVVILHQETISRAM